MVKGTDTGDSGAADELVVRRLALLVVVEGLAVAVLSVLYALNPLLDEATDLAGAELAAAMGVLAGVVLVILARGLGRCKPWAWAPTVVLNLLALPVGIGLLRATRWPAGVIVLVLALGALSQLFRPTLAALLRRQQGGSG